MPRDDRTLAFLALGDLKEAVRNPKRHHLEAIGRSVSQFGFVEPLVMDERTGRLVAGHGRLETLRELEQKGSPRPPGLKVDKGGAWLVPVLRGWSSESDAEAESYLLASNRLVELGGWDRSMLDEALAGFAEAPALLEASGWGDLARRQLEEQRRKEEERKQREARVTLAQRFGVPPFSLLDARQGYWQDRKRAWLALGIRSELGRPGNLLQMSDTVLAAGAKKPKGAFGGPGSTFGPSFEAHPSRVGDENRSLSDAYDGGDAWGNAGTSIFDPVLCELAYRWWAPAGGRVLDPFAGGSVRGVVAGHLGLAYRGVDLSAGQVEENEKQAKEIAPDADLAWTVGDARTVLADSAWEPTPFDLVFTCPPYFDLERYSSDPADLSNAPGYDRFLEGFAEVMDAAVGRLAPDSFVVMVVGEIRDPKGWCRGFVSDVETVVHAAGAAFYNDCVLVTSLGSLALRAARIFGGARKVGKAHQNVLVFVKGDPQRAADRASEFTPEDVAALFGELAEAPAG